MAAAAIVPPVKAIDTKVHTFDFGRVAEYCRSNVAGFAAAEKSLPLKAYQFTHGQSNPTFLLTVGKGEAERKFVLRKKPAGKLLQSAHLIDREYRVMQALAGSKVPVPRMYAYCNDESLIGTAFYVMSYVEGRIFKDVSLPKMPEEARFAIYSDMNRVLGALHAIDVKTIGLSDFGKTTDYVARQVDRWTKQYEMAKTSDIPAVNQLIKYLRDHLPSADPDTAKVCLTHGDFRLDNLIFHPTQYRVIAVLDWELSTLGHPTVDLAHNCMVYHFPADEKKFPGLENLNLRSLGIPTEYEYLEAYGRNAHRSGPITNYSYYAALSCFRMASIGQGVYARSIQGNASNTSATTFGEIVKVVAAKGLQLSQTKLPVFIEQLAEVKMSLAPVQFSKDWYALRSRLIAFMNEHIYPNMQLFEDQHAELSKKHGTRWVIPPIMEQLKAKARAAGLWNLFLSKRAVAKVQIEHTFPGLTNLEYAPLCEIMGRLPNLAPEVFNCSAPDTGNMETIALYGTKQQQAEWLAPLMNGEIRSAFGMTEPGVASSDATNIEASIERDGDTYVINGRKWWTSGAMDPRCKIIIFMGKTNPKAPTHAQQSMVLVPMEAKGVRVIRHLDVYGFDDAPHGHAEVEFKDVRVPVSNILLGEGRGFEIAQGRLGPGRIHHCMRLIGMAETALEAMTRRVQTRTVFGQSMSKKGVILHDIAQSRIEIEQSRLLTLQAAALMDTVGSKGARQSIAMIKVAAPAMATAVFDRAIQAHGGAGVQSDFPLARSWSGIRTLRLADGPDEVHRETVAKVELRRSKL